MYQAFFQVDRITYGRILTVISISKHLTCYYQNVRRLRTKTQELFLTTLTATQYDVIAFTESWLNSNFTNFELFDVHFYDTFRCDRNYESINVNRGGVVFAVNKTLNPLFIDLNAVWDIARELVMLDILCIRINFLGNILYILLLYIPLKTTCDTYVV